MPLQYSDQSVGESHLWTREKCSIFDVSHMYVSAVLYRMPRHINGLKGAAHV